TAKKPRKTTTKKTNFLGNSDDDSSDSSGQGWTSKLAKTKANFAIIEKYRKYLRSPGPDLVVCD
ncbi:unnamed protein product, partial [Rotaria magnacalcarata]